MTNNKQQTGVEILYRAISDRVVMQDETKALICIHISHDDLFKIHRQAKEMEKERMIDFAYNALKIADNTRNRYVDVDKLYKELYGGGEQ